VTTFRVAFRVKPIVTEIHAISCLKFAWADYSLQVEAISVQAVESELRKDYILHQATEIDIRICPCLAAEAKATDVRHTDSTDRDTETIRGSRAQANQARKLKRS
jgi:hypothetical protein